MRQLKESRGQRKQRDEYAVVLDYLPHGYALEPGLPIIQAIGTASLTLLELVPKKGVAIELKEKVYIGPGKREKIHHIKARLNPEKITETAKINLEEFIQEWVNEHEAELVDFFNKAEAINKRVHQLELLEGFGKKHVEHLLEERSKKPFESFSDLKQRIKGLVDPKKAIEKRILKELTEPVRFRLFTIK